VEELQQCIMEGWEHLDQRVIDNAVKQWHKRLHACVAAFLTSFMNVIQHLLIMLSFIVTQFLFCIKIDLVLCLFT